MNVIDDTIDFDAYLSGPDESAHVRPASDWMDAVLEAFERPPHLSGSTLPWAKTHEILRLRRSELTIASGANGHGKSMLIGQIALGLMAQGEKVCIASMEMKPHETMQRMCRQAFGCNQPANRDIRDIAKWTNGKLWLYDQQGAVTPERILAVARYCQKVLGVTHFIIDNLLSCGIPEDGEGWQSKQKQFVLDLACHAHDTRQAVYLLAHVRKGKDELSPPSKYDVRGSASITDLADNVFTIWRNKAKEKAHDEGDSRMDDDPDCLLIVDKNRHGNWEGRIQLWFDRNSQTYLESRDAMPKAMSLICDDDTVEF